MFRKQSDLPFDGENVKMIYVHAAVSLPEQQAIKTQWEFLLS